MTSTDVGGRTGTGPAEPTPSRVRIDLTGLPASVRVLVRALSHVTEPQVKAPDEMRRELQFVRRGASLDVSVPTMSRGDRTSSHTASYTATQDDHDRATSGSASDGRMTDSGRGRTAEAPPQETNGPIYLASQTGHGQIGAVGPNARGSLHVDMPAMDTARQQQHGATINNHGDVHVGTQDTARQQHGATINNFGDVHVLNEGGGNAYVGAMGPGAQGHVNGVPGNAGDLVRDTVDTTRGNATPPGPARLDVEVPTGASVEFKGDADVALKGQFGDVNIQNASHGTDMREASVDTARLQSDKGDMHVGRAGDVQVKGGDGDVRIGHATGNTEVTTRNGDVTIDKSDGDVRVKSGNGNVAIASDGNIHARSEGGSVNSVRSGATTSPELRHPDRSNPDGRGHGSRAQAQAKSPERGERQQ